MGNRHPGSRSRVPECQPVAVRFAPANRHHQIRLARLHDSNRTGSTHRHDQRPGPAAWCRSGHQRKLFQREDRQAFHIRTTRWQSLWRDDSSRSFPHRRRHHGPRKQYRNLPLRLDYRQRIEEKIQEYPRCRSAAVERRCAENGKVPRVATPSVPTCRRASTNVTREPLSASRKIIR